MSLVDGEVDGMNADLPLYDVEELVCPKCQAQHRAGELICPTCGLMLSTEGKTRKLGSVSRQSIENKPRSMLNVVQKEKLIFEIGAEKVLLPLEGTFTVGRTHDASATPHVDLSPFDAEENGISRLHAKIQWRASLAYISDLKSTNGTLLNNRQLLPGLERTLRHNDDLQLGSLKIKVRLESIFDHS